MGNMVAVTYYLNENGAPTNCTLWRHDSVFRLNVLSSQVVPWFYYLQFLFYM